MKKVTAAIILHEGKILIAKRGKGDPLANHWEFPGGKIEAGETPEECLKREIKEELNIDIHVGNFLGNSIYHYEGGSIELLAYFTTYEKGEVTPKVHDEVKWVARDELGQFLFAPADIPFVKKMEDYQ